MAIFNINNFRQTVLKGGMARQNRYELQLISPIANNNELVSLLCESTALPQMNIGVKSFKIFGPAYQRPITAEYGGEGIIMSFYVDRQMRVKKFFDEWMHKVIAPGTFEVQFMRNYVKDIHIFQLDEAEEPQYQITLVDAFPRMTNIMELNSSANNSVHKLSVTFAYRYWETQDISHRSSGEQYSLVDVQNTYKLDKNTEYKAPDPGTIAL